MLRPCGLCLFASLALLAVSPPAVGQFRLRGENRFFDAVQSEPAADSSTRESASESQPSVDELLRRLDELEGRTQPAAPARERGLALMLEDARLTSTNLYDPEGIRYFSARLLIINLTDQTMTVPSRGMVLVADDREHTLADAQTALSRSLIQVGDQAQRFPPIPESIDVAPRGTASTWVVYAGIASAAAVPSMRLKVDWEGGSEELDINAYERGILALRTERLGPEDCAALLTINGELNTVNAGALTAELDALTAAGIARVVVAWGESAAPPEDQVLGWLATGTSQDTGMQFAQLPQIPVTIREFHVVVPADGRAQQYFMYGAATPMHRTPEEAVSAALRTAFDVVPRSLLRDELAHGHRWSRAAGLAHAGGRLGRRELPLVLASCDDPEPSIRRQGLAALGQFGEPEAIDRLLQAAGSTDHETALAAIGSLAGSRYPLAQRALAKHLDAIDDARALQVIDILARQPRAEWIERIAAYFQSGEPPLQLAALRALIRLGHPQIIVYLETALQSPDPQLRAEAFAQLAQRTDPRSEELALAYALPLLKTSPPDAATHALLTRTRELRALPALLGHLDSMTGDREQMIELIAQLGGPDVFPGLLERYPRLTAGEQAAVLDEMFAARAPGLRPLALAALAKGEPQLLEVATRILTARPDRETVPVLAKALGKAESIDAWSTLCNALANVGDAAARAALLAVRDQPDRSKRDQVVGALTRIKHTSPAYQYSILASQEIEDGEQQKALRLLELAIMFDPDYAEAYSQRGHLQLLRQKYPDARSDFERACELDPLDSLAVTGRAIVTVLQGDAASGVEQVKAARDTFTGDARFEYNAACVYGRAIESLQNSTADDADALRAEYQSAALRHLKNSMLLGFVMPEFIKGDPDLAVLRELPEFQTLLASPPSPGAEAADDPNREGDAEFDIRTLR